MNTLISRLASTALGGKKILFVLAAVGLIAAGCGSSKTASDQNSSTGQQGSVSVNNPDDAANLLVSASSDEQNLVSAEEDSDLAVDPALTSLEEVSNGY